MSDLNLHDKKFTPRPYVNKEERFRVYCRIARLTQIASIELDKTLIALGNAEGLTPTLIYEIMEEVKAAA